MPIPFISREDLSDYLGRNITADDGALLAVDAACDICRTLAEQSFDEDTTVLTLDGTGTDALLLPELPVSNVGTVTVNGSTITNYSLGANGVLFRGTPSTSDPYWPADPIPPATWPYGRQNIVVSYTHGYAGTIPSDVRMVALSIASRLVIQGVAVQETVGDTSIRYAGPATDLSNGELRILRKYRQSQ